MTCRERAREFARWRRPVLAPLNVLRRMIYLARTPAGTITPWAEGQRAIGVALFARTSKTLLLG